MKNKQKERIKQALTPNVNEFETLNKIINDKRQYIVLQWGRNRN